MTTHDLLAPMVGRRFAGGCDTCDAWQELRRHHGVYIVTISHDDDCPTLRAIQARREATS
jgi:hypothetical protein